MNHRSLEVATYNITFKWISGVCNKAVDYLSRLVEVPECNAQVKSIIINIITTSSADSPTIHTQNNTKVLVEVPPTDALKVNTPPPLTRDCRDTLLQVQLTDSFCKHISKWLNNGNAPHHELDAFTYSSGLLYKHAMDVTQKFLVLVIPKSWYFMVLVEALDKLDYQRVTRTNHIIK